MRTQSILQGLIAASESGFTATAIKATVAVLAALLVIRLARRASASLRHLLAATTFGVLLLLPFASALVKPRVVRVDAPAPARVAARDAARPAGGDAGVPTAKRTMSVAAIAWRVYLGGVALFVLTLAGGLWRVRRMRERGEVSVAGTRLANEMARAMGRSGGIEVMISAELAVPITFGFGRRVILLPAATSEWSEEELRRAIRHELEHIARSDWPTQIAARLACALYWPHPLVWALWSRLRLEAERACDDAVIRGAAEPESYAEQLVSLARRLVGRGSVPVLAMATRGNLGIRVEAILDRGLRRTPLSRFGSVAVAAVAVTCLAVVAPLQIARAAEGRAEKHWNEPDVLDVALLEAAADGNLQRMRGLIDRGAKLDVAIPGDGSALIAASRGGHLEAVRFLLSLGVNVDRGVQGDGNALIMAAGEGNVDVIRLLLDAGADIEAVVPGDENPLIHASEHGKLDAVRLLLERGANANARVWATFQDGDRVRGEWRTPLGVATHGGHDDVVALLRSAGAKTQ